MSVVEITPPDPLVTAWLDTSDFGNGKRLVHVAQGRLLWIEDAEAWAFFDGRRWDMARGATEAIRIAHQVIEHIGHEALALGQLAEDARALAQRVGPWCTPEVAQKRVEVLQSHAVRSGSAGMTGGMLKQARGFLFARLEDFDVDPLVYNTLNATLRFVRRGDGWVVEDRPHEMADRLMQMANVEYDPSAKCPFWDARLKMLIPDEEQWAAFQILYGYTMTGLVSDQSFYVHQGKGGDGKSMTHMALADLHGDYYRHAGIKTFLQGRDGGGAEHRSDLVRLRGDIRFVTSDEPKARAVWDGEVIKQITGSFVTARGANERTEVTFTPRFKLFAECNVIPKAPSDDKGFRRRFKLFQWRVSLEDVEGGAMPPDEVLARLKAEKSGILNWLIVGACEWLATRKVPQPEAMRAVLEEFWAESSPLLEWMNEWCDTSDPEAREGTRVLWMHFKDWCEGRGIEPLSETKFGTALLNKQFVSRKDAKGVRYRPGIRLRTSGLYDAPVRGADAVSDAAAGPLSPRGKSDAGPAVFGGEDDDYVPDWEA